MRVGDGGHHARETPVPVAGIVVLVALLALAGLLVGCQQGVGASQATGVPQSGSRDVVTLRQAAAVVGHHFITLAHALKAGDARSSDRLLASVDTGPALGAERNTVGLLRAGGVRAPVNASPGMASVFVSHQRRYPASFLALAPAPLGLSNGKRLYFLRAFTREGPQAPWLQTLMAETDNQSGRLDAIQIDPSGYALQVPNDDGVGGIRPSMLPSGFATYLGAIVEGQPVPQQPAIAGGPHTDQHAQAIKQANAQLKSAAIAVRSSFAPLWGYGPYSYAGPRGTVFTLFGAHETYDETTSRGLCLSQPPQRSWFGSGVAPGLYNRAIVDQIDMIGAVLQPGKPVTPVAGAVSTTTIASPCG